MGYSKRDDQSGQLIEAYTPVCSGQTSSIAAAYAGTIHPMALIISPLPATTNWQVQAGDFSSTPEYRENGTRVPDGLLPAALNKVQLVVCIKESDVVVDSCGLYSGAHGAVEVFRTKFVEDIRIVVATTGREIGRTTLEGAPVESCPQQMRESAELAGSEVTVDQAFGFLGAFSSGPIRES